MSFVDVRLFGADIIYDTTGGGSFSTEVVPVKSGKEVRNANWPQSRWRGDLGERLIRRSELDYLNEFFHAMRGRAHSFRHKDWADYQVTVAKGLLGAGSGSGLAAYQLYKRYTLGGQITDRKIQKPVAGTAQVFRNGSLVTAGGAAGNYALDTTTGIVTFVADASAAVTGVTVGGTTVVTLASALAGLAVGGKLFLSGLGGTVAATLNGLAHSIAAIAANVYTLSIVTTGLAYTSGGTGLKYPQPTEPLVWAGEFDVPVRFDADEIKTQFRAMDGAESLHFLFSLPLIEDLQ
ncbi:MAG: DUF2460 domain-containing protein [Gammaproteobacteria bacterium]|nr:DUF2460 domain-containing protein [Gammaproteobacteria bacterium]